MIHVLTLTWNGLHHLRNLKNGLFDNLKQTKQPYRWYIRSNGCKDGTTDEVFTWDNVDVLSIDHNRDSFSTGVNSLFKLANPKDNDLILLLNNDIAFRDKVSLKHMLDLMSKTDASVCGCRMMYTGTNKISHVGVAFSKAHGNMPWHFRMGKNIQKSDKQHRYFQAVTAACCFVNAGCFKKAGMMDENLQWAFEDICLNLEISLNQKKKIICCGTTEIDHDTSATLKKNNYNKLFLSHNVVYFKNKWLGKYKLDYDLYNNPKYNVIKS